MKQKDLICISMTTWEGDYMKTIVHMMSQMAKEHRVLFVDYAFTWKDVFMAMLGKGTAPVKRMLGIQPRLRTLQTRSGDQIYHLTLPPVFPINWIQSSRWFARCLRLQSIPVVATIHRVIDQLGFDAPVMINAFHPVMGCALADKLPVSATIYYCYDEIRAAQWAGVHGGRYEDRFIPKTDGVIVTSKQLYHDRSQKHENVSLIKNGVDFELFHRAYHADSQQVKSTIGYLGSVDDRLDYDLLDQLIAQNPHREFHFVGRVTYPAGKEALSKHQNVKFFGAQAPDAIPGYLEKFDVGLIPFATNEFTKNIYPLKINEYLAAGIPVVSTDFADLSDFTDCVHIVKTLEDFVDAIEQALVYQPISTRKRRAEVARANGWESRAELMETFLDELDPQPLKYAQ